MQGLTLKEFTLSLIYWSPLGEWSMSSRFSPVPTCFYDAAKAHDAIIRAQTRIGVYHQALSHLYYEEQGHEPKEIQYVLEFQNTYSGQWLFSFPICIHHCAIQLFICRHGAITNLASYGDISKIQTIYNIIDQEIQICKTAVKFFLFESQHINFLPMRIVYGLCIERLIGSCKKAVYDHPSSTIQIYQAPLKIELYVKHSIQKGQNIHRI